jgi:hypothetical protein
MTSADVRLDVIEAMRASPRVDHSLILGDYLLEPRAEELLNRSASAPGVTGPEFAALVGGLPELEFLVPISRHRLTWTGSGRVAVAAQWNSDVLDIAVYEPSGEWLEVLNEEDRKSVHGYEALFMVRPRETDGTRIGRQPDVPGPVIQDPGDGQQAAVLSWRVAGGEEVSFDVGQLGSAAEFHAVVAETMETRGVWGLSTGALANGVAKCELDDVNCDGWWPGVGDGSGPWGDPETFVDRVVMRKNLDIGNGDMELRLIMQFKSGNHKYPGLTWERYGLRKGLPLVPDTTAPNFDPRLWLIHYKSPITGGLYAEVHAWEMDPGWALNADDDLGTQQITPQDSGQIKYFEHDGDDAMELTLVWDTVEDPDPDG